jgi:polar amino acid transport system substrate-binding protein
MGTEGAYPPFNFINEANELVGFEIDLGNELCARANLTCEWVITTGTRSSRTWWRQLRHDHRRHERTEARAEVISFTQAYKRPDPSAYMALAGTDPSVIDTG